MATRSHQGRAPIRPDTRALRAAGYCRTSGEGQRDNTSIPTQRAAVERFCKMAGWVLVRIYVDECRSGATTEGRDEFNRMFRDAAADQFDVIVPFDTSRFARDGVDVVSTAKVLKEQYGIVTVDSKGQFDNRSHRNAMGNFVHAGMAEANRLYGMEQMLTGRVARAKAGLPWCRCPPFGRQWRRTCGCTKALRGEKCRCGKGEWVVGEKGRALAALLEEYVSGRPYVAGDPEYQAATGLRELAPKYGFRSGTRVQEIVHTSQLAARPYVVTFDTPEIGLHEVVEVPGIPPLISEELHRRVLDRLEHNRTWNKQHLRRYVLSGFLYCTHCGRSLTGGRKPNYVFYIHHRDNPGPGTTCPFRRVPASVVEGPVLGFLYRLITDRPSFELAVKMALPAPAERAAKESEVKRLAKELGRVEKAIANMVRAVEEGAPASRYVARQLELEAEAKALGERLAAAEADLGMLPDPVLVEEQVMEIQWRLMREHTGKDWRAEAHDDVVRYLRSLFGDNPKREGLGVFVRREKGQWSAEVRARLEYGAGAAHATAYAAATGLGKPPDSATTRVDLSCLTR
jgi:site-specific DNA recombinase